MLELNHKGQQPLSFDLNRLQFYTAKNTNIRPTNTFLVQRKVCSMSTHKKIIYCVTYFVGKIMMLRAAESFKC